MKRLTLLTALSLSLVMVSCVKRNQRTKPNIREDVKVNPVKFTREGMKCDIVGEADNKEIFIELRAKEGKKIAYFYDFTSASKITLMGGSFADYNLLTFTMEPSPESDQVLTGETMLTHKDESCLSDEGKVMLITGRLTLNKDMSGKLEQSLMLSMDDKTVKQTDFQEVAKIENCEEFEASFM